MESQLLKPEAPAKRSHPFRPSKLGLRSKCSGSMRFEEDLPDLVSDDAQEGTNLHAVVRALLEGRFLPIPLNDEQQWAVDQCLKFHAENTLPDSLVDYEVPVEFCLGEDKVPGTADVVMTQVMNGRCTMRLIDWKFHRNALDPDDIKLQLAAYALAILQQAMVQEVEVFIYAPRLGQVWKGSYRSEEEILPTLESIRSACLLEDLVLSPGSHCKWCRAQAICPAFMNWARKEETQLEKAVGGLSALEPQKLNRTIEAAYAFEKWAEQVKRAAKELPPETLAAAGWDLKERPGNRYVKDAVSAFSAQGELTQEEFLALVKIPVGEFEEKWVDKFSVRSGHKKKTAKERFSERLANVLGRGDPVRTLVRKGNDS